MQGLIVSFSSSINWSLKRLCTLAQQQLVPSFQQRIYFLLQSLDLEKEEHCLLLPASNESLLIVCVFRALTKGRCFLVLSLTTPSKIRPTSQPSEERNRAKSLELHGSSSDILCLGDDRKVSSWPQVILQDNGLRLRCPGLEGIAIAP